MYSSVTLTNLSRAILTSVATRVKKICKVDLGFLIGGSSSVEKQGRGNFQKVINFVKQIVNEFEISQHDTHVGVVLFDDKANVVFGFHNYTDKSSIMSTISSIKNRGGGMLTGKALSIAHNGLYKTSSRNGTPKILIVLTGDTSWDNVKDPAQKLRDSGVTIYAVGVGIMIGEDELKEMATDPDADHVFTSSFNNLVTIVQAIKNNICQGEDISFSYSLIIHEIFSQSGNFISTTTNNVSFDLTNNTNCHFITITTVPYSYICTCNSVRGYPRPDLRTTEDHNLFSSCHPTRTSTVFASCKIHRTNNVDFPDDIHLSNIMAENNEQNALRAFELAFTSNGYNHAPRGLRALIVNFTLKPGETIEQGRRRLYRRIFGILWFGNHVGRSYFVPQTPTGSPTYVFPAFLKEAIRTHISGSLRAFQDPEGPG
ncbi:hypothetical protein QZH41_020692, partial [Actinostola sp. cb2023]